MSDKEKTPMQISIERKKEKVEYLHKQMESLKTDRYHSSYNTYHFGIKLLTEQIEADEQLLPVEREFWIDARDTPAYLNREDYEKDFDKKYGTDEHTS